MLRRLSLLVVLVLLAAVAGACGGDDDAGPASTTQSRSVTAVTEETQDQLRRSAAREFGQWASRANPRIARLRTEIDRAERAGDRPALAEALTAYAAECRRARSVLVRIRMPIAAWDPAAALAVALARTSTSADAAAIALRAGRIPDAAVRAELREALAAQREASTRLRAQLGLAAA